MGALAACIVERESLQEVLSALAKSAERVSKNDRARMTALSQMNVLEWTESDESWARARVMRFQQVCERRNHEDIELYDLPKYIQPAE